MSASRPFMLRGGLNLAGLTLELKPGEATLMENFEVLPEGGYREVDGFERLDGHPEPHEAVYLKIPFVGGLAAGVVPGDVLTGGSSGATAKVLDVLVTSGSFVTNSAAGVFVVDRVVGTFTTNEVLRVLSSDRATMSATIQMASPIDEKYDDWLALAVDSAREAITAVPGEGGVLGVAVYKGRVQAFRNDIGSLTASMYESSAGGWVLRKSGLAPNGRYEFRVHNFKGAASQRKLYGVSGTHKAFEWDGTNWVDITTGMAADKPTHLEVHRNYLWLSFTGGSLQNSPVGDPTAVWTLRTGSAEFGIGDEMTALKTTKGGVLVIYCLNSTKFLYGKSAADWDLQDGSDTSGAYAGSVCEAPNGDVLAIDERGLMPLQATQSFGDFESASISQRIDQFLKRRRRMLVGCVPVKDKAQYRAFYSDGLGFTLTYRGDRLAGYSFFRLPVVPTCLFAGEDANGNAMLLMGAANGFVYRLDVGYSYDGIAIEHILRLASDSCGSPRVLKQFLSGSLQIVAPRPVSVLVKPEFDYSLTEADIAQTVGAQRSVLSDAWDVANWDELAWDVGDERGSITYPEFNIDGNGLAISLVIYHGGEIKPPITIESGIYNFNNRGQRPRGGFGL